MPQAGHLPWLISSWSEGRGGGSPWIATRSVRGGPRVLILPGIMGSKLGRRGTFFDDVIVGNGMDGVLDDLVRIRPRNRKED